MKWSEDKQWIKIWLFIGFGIYFVWWSIQMLKK